jgi:hypothetical protein
MRILPTLEQRGPRFSSMGMHVEPQDVMISTSFEKCLVVEHLDIIASPLYNREKFSAAEVSSELSAT